MNKNQIRFLVAMIGERINLLIVAVFFAFMGLCLNSRYPGHTELIITGFALINIGGYFTDRYFSTHYDFLDDLLPGRHHVE